jgi:hypothetical protein
MGRLSLALLALSLPASVLAAGRLDPLYQRIAADLKRGKPLVVTVHVALCDNSTLWCGHGGMGNGDRPRRNLYWGGAAGFRAYFDRARGYQRVLLDGGDGETILERAVYRRRVTHPSAGWRRLGITGRFDVLVVGLAYRGRAIGRAMEALAHQTRREDGMSLQLGDGTRLAVGGQGHVVGYAGHNHLMDDPSFRFPRARRRAPIGFFALCCLSAPYLARELTSRPASALLLTMDLMYPGAFTVDGLVQGLTEAQPQASVFQRGVEHYARFQRREMRRLRWAFIHDGEARFRTRFARTTEATTVKRP